MLTDIDEPNSKISRILFPKGSYSKTGRILFGSFLALLGIFLYLNFFILLGLLVLILAFIPHRGILHSPAFLGVLTIVILFQNGSLGNYYYLFVGYASHIIADFLTDRGIPLFYPFSQKKYGLNIITTGGLSEYLFLILLILCVLNYV